MENKFNMGMVDCIKLKSIIKIFVISRKIVFYTLVYAKHFLPPNVLNEHKDES